MMINASACQQIKSGVVGLIGPADPFLGSHTHSICVAMGVPHLQVRPYHESSASMDAHRSTGPTPYDDGSGFRPPAQPAVNLYPPNVVLTRAVTDLMSFLNWTQAAVLYEDDFGLIKFQDLGQPEAGTPNLGVVRRPPDIYLRQGVPPFYRSALKDIKNRRIFNIVVDTKSQYMNGFLRAILQLQMNDDRYHYVFTSFDVETFDLEDFKYNYVNMTAFRLVDSGERHVRNTLRDMEEYQPFGNPLLNRTGVIEAGPAMIYDSVFVLAHGLQAMFLTHSLTSSAVGGNPFTGHKRQQQQQQQKPMMTMTTLHSNASCWDKRSWNLGHELFRHVDGVKFHGLTGPLEFSGGKRKGLKFDLLKLRQEKLVKVGEWREIAATTMTTSTSGGGDEQRTWAPGITLTDENVFYEGRAPNVTLRVTTILEVPYVMLEDDHMNRTGNARYKGFCVDLLKLISKLQGFDYKIQLVKDDKYGVFHLETKEWDGIVNELIQGEADLAVAAMTITHARENVIDFTKPFMNLGISILFKVPTSQPTRLFSFMNPLAIEIWLYIMAAYVLVSFTMFVMARFSPYEWNNPHPCRSDVDVVENQFSVSNSFWFITGTLLKQTSGLSPRAASTRIVGAIWWFFTLIIISSYTANLAAFLTVERMITPIESAEDLAEQDNIDYGTLYGGSTMTFFRDAQLPTYQKMWTFMNSRKTSAFVNTYEEGIKRVLKGNYAFLMESTTLDYIVQRNCNLTQIGGLLDSKGYGIATPRSSPWRDRISLAILELQEKGTIQMLFNKWWKNTGDTCHRDDKNKDSKANALGKSNIGGVFVVLLSGLALSLIVALLEFCWVSKKNAESTKQPMCREMMSELKFAMRCSASRQRPTLHRTCSRCLPTSTYVPASLDPQQENGLMPMFELHRSSLVNYDLQDST
ncbi:unnamed protein product [Notodromas monacha]|uniref:Glutamate receptor ionotropic, kainate 2 n=1 Tax=Notodromas monacha TaxID=399045 RepID=A0A7R9GCY5_9CRUS|nr:unnamed protein product [Notodromas monacha]CAG0916424.1 unnamed protein product [Notodromas monacha]